MSFKFQFVISVALGLIGIQSAYGAACCGGGFALPGMITGDEKASLTGSYSLSEIIYDVNAEGWWKNHQDGARTGTMRLDVAQVFADRFQVGAGIPFTDAGVQSLKLADVSAHLGYEFLPDWDYNPLRPHGIAYLAIKMPTGSSVYDQVDDQYQSPTGKGFWTIGAGALLNKSWSEWDALLGFELHRSLARSVNNSTFNGRVIPGMGHSVSFGGGYSWSDLRLGATATTVEEAAIRSEGSIESQGAPQSFVNFALQMSYLFANSMAATMTYSDQTLLGNPMNASLEKSFGIAIQKRWSR